MAEGSYSRLYWCFAQEYPEIYHDDRALAAFVRLLLLADGTYPAPPPLPRNLKRQALQSLVGAGLVEIDPDVGHYNMKGLVAERERRKKHAKDAADKRWQGERKTAETMPSADARASDASNAPADADVMLAHPPPASDENMPRRDERDERDEKRVHTHRAGARADGPAAPPSATSNQHHAGERPLAVGAAAPTASLGHRSHHRSHATCGRVCVPAFLHDEFRRALGGDEDQADQALRTWYAEVLAGLPDQVPVDADGVRFWRERFRVWSSAARASAAVAGGPGYRCPHDPPCRRTQDCIARFLEEERQAREAAIA